MPTSKSHVFLYVIVFSAGLTSLSIELAASRLLDPWFGNSIFVWASLIALILLYLSIGYWLGGAIADRYPQELTLYTLVALAALCVGLVPLLSRPVLRLAAGVFVTYDAAILLGSFTATMLLFGPAVILLGCVSPFAIRLLVHGSEDAGSTSGRVYALSTLGSILGIFITVLLLIPNLGTRRTFLLLALVLLGLAIIALFPIQKRRALLFAVAWLLLLAITLFSDNRVRTDAAMLYEKESAYNYIQVVQNGSEVLLKLNEGAGVHSVYRPDMALADGIWDYFLLAPFFRQAGGDESRIDSMLMIGLAAGTVPKLYTAAFGDITIDGVELDPAIIAAARQYFSMDEPNLRAIAQDGRYFLNHGAGAYDVIAVDAYRPPYIPFHLATSEFFVEVRDHLKPDGVVAVNAARTSTDYQLVDALAATMASVFPSVFIIDEPDLGFDIGNSLIIATSQPVTLDAYTANTAMLEQPQLQEIARRAAPHIREATAREPILRDDQAPVEQIIHGIVLRYLLRE